MIPTDPDTKLDRGHAAVALTAAGFPIAAATLGTLACRGDGPPYERFGRSALYTWGSTLAWAESRSKRQTSRRAA